MLKRRMLYRSNGVMVTDITTTKPHPWSVEELEASSPTGTKMVQGTTRVRHREGWTLFSFWDRSNNPESNSFTAVILEGVHSFDQAHRISIELFPDHFSKLKFAVRTA